MPIDVVVPQLGESVSEGEILLWRCADGDGVAVDEILLELETDKTTVEIPSPAAGTLRILKPKGSTVTVGEVLARIEEATGAKAAGTRPAARREAAMAASTPASASAAAPASSPAFAPPPSPAFAPASSPATSPTLRSSAAAASGASPRLGPAARRLAEEQRIDPAMLHASGPGGRATKADVSAAAAAVRQTPVAPPSAAGIGRAPALTSAASSDGAPAAASAAGIDRAPASAPAAGSDRAPTPAASSDRAPASAHAASGGEDSEERVRLTRLRRTIADRLVAAQHTAAILTTFNEIDMSAAMELRARHKERFEKAHGVSLGFMSIFARACVLALRDVPVVGAHLDGDEIVTRKRLNLGIAASTDRGLVVPIVRSADLMSMAELEREIGRLAVLAREGKLGVEDLSGGTFTISNGGVFGSLLSTPILNPPQSGILGMHKIEKRPVVVADQIVIRPMMYVALSYDHRIVDGREAVTFLVRVKERVEDPSRLLLEI